MSDDGLLRAMVSDWAAAVVSADRTDILAQHADDVLIFDCSGTGRGNDAYAQTWDFFAASRLGPVAVRAGEITVTAGDTAAFAACEMH